MTMSTEAQESNAAKWLKRLREAEAAEEHLRRTGQRLAHEAGPTGKKLRVQSKPRFARVWIAERT